MFQQLASEDAWKIAEAAKAARDAKSEFLNKSRVLDRNRDGDEAVEQLDAGQDVLAAAGDDRRQAALREELSRLSGEQLLELMAATYIGRGEFAPKEWPAACAAAQDRSNAADIDRLSDSSALHDELAKGLHLLNVPRQVCAPAETAS